MIQVQTNLTTNIPNCSEALLHLSLIDGVGSVTIDALIQYFGIDTIDAVYKASVFTLQQAGIVQSKASKIVTGLQDASKLHQEQSLACKHGITILTRADADYPAQLQEITCPPAVLYVAGDASLLAQQSVAFVGARRAGGYARSAMSMLVPDVVHAGYVVVSGGALGADTFAHEQTLQSGGKTVAVLGSGLLRLYPAQNKLLFSHIVESGGALVSPFSLQTSPLAGNFPARNRIIAGLSQACCVVQAAAKSGALGTAHFALEQGRQVCAVPGLIDDPLSQGCHALMRQGAVLVQHGNDIVQELGGKQVGAKSLADRESCMSEPVRALLQILHTPVPLQYVVEQLDVPLAYAQEQLFDLLMQGLVTQTASGLWCRI